PWPANLSSTPANSGSLVMSADSSMTSPAAPASAGSGIGCRLSSTRFTPSAARLRAVWRPTRPVAPASSTQRAGSGILVLAVQHDLVQVRLGGRDPGQLGDVL